MKLSTLSLLALAGLPTAVRSLDVGFSTYDNTFIDPKYVLDKKSWNETTIPAQQTILQWADFLNAQGPWAVTDKPFAPASGDKHDYMSWAPYWWPNCTNAGNTTELTPEQIWTTCPYSQRDGQFNPDVRTVNNTGAFDTMANAVLYNALAWVINGSASYSQKAASYVRIWFLDPETAMNPNLNYAQIQRGPDKNMGTHTGVLDLKGMAKIATGLLVLQGGNSPDWTSDLSTQFANWTSTYVKWLTTSPIALAEKAATNNHGSFYYNQLAACHIIANDTQGAQDTVKEFFSSLFLKQINSDGEQPLEAERTHPYHYRNYNLAALLTNAAIGAYTGFDAYHAKSSQGATIQDALNFAMTVPPGEEPADELWPNVANVAAVYGDPDLKYAQFLAGKDDSFPVNPWFFWLQPMSDMGLGRALVNSTATSGGSVSSSGSKPSSSQRADNGAVGNVAWDVVGVLGAGLAAVLLI